jgi:dTDP-4-dehydrorhamnose reductase
VSAPDILVIGRDGQLARSLAERARTLRITLASIGRPELDLAHLEMIGPELRGMGAKIIINAAAYTAVDLAESESSLSEQVNAIAPGVIAAEARAVGARVVHLSTDYVFDGASTEPYVESATVGPLGVYGRTKLSGEGAVRAAGPDHAIVRTSWVYSPFGRNFVRTMLELARTRERLRVVDDQIGNPTSALDLADGLLVLATSWLAGGEVGLGQTYHLAGTGATSWAGLARETFAISARLGGPTAQVEPIATSQWPTAAARPRNSRLDSSRFAADFGFSAPPWRESLALVVQRLLEDRPAR